MSIRSTLAVIAVVASAAVGAAIGPGRAGAEQKCLPAPARADAIGAFARQIKVGRPRKHGNLTLYPILIEDVRVPDVDLTLDEAMERELLSIRELDPPEVNRVRLVSKAKEPILVMGGEMLAGAKQDRIVGDDMIVPPRADLEIPVFCVEHGRWVAKSESFGSAKFLATRDVRVARASADQGEVWSKVAEAQERLAAPSETGALRSLQDSAIVQDRIKPYRRALAEFPGEVAKARGVVACVGDEIIAADLFASRAIFAQLWPKLLDSYITDAVERELQGSSPDGVRIRKWLDGLASADKSLKKTPGDGLLYELRGESLIGSALVYDEAVVHIELFAKEKLAPEPVPFNRLEFRRDRLERE
jgi:hypothetical protein